MKRTMNRIFLYHTVFLSIILLVFSSCSKTPESGYQQSDEAPVYSEAKPVTSAVQNRSSKPEPSITLEGDDIILARVNKTPITQYDLEQNIRDMFDRETIKKIGKKERANILESMIKSRAIAHAFEKIITPEDIAVLDKKVKSYREQMMVKMYLVRKTNPEPVTLKMIKDYYDKHPEKLGGKTIREFEMIATNDALNGKKRDLVIQQLNQSDKNHHWKDWVQNLQKQGCPVIYRKGDISEKLLTPKLLQIMKSLKTGETSPLNLIKGRLYVIRILGEKKIPPRPLAEVSADIRKALVPAQLKKAIKIASKQVLKDTTIVREKDKLNQR